MNRIRYFVPVLLASVLCCASASAQGPVYQDYWGVVVEAWGPQATVFASGERVLVSYNLNPGALDANDSPNAGTYPGGLFSLRFSIPGQSIDVAGGWGVVWAFNDVPDDGVVLFTMDIPAGNVLDGAPVQDLEAGFWGAPSMLDDDSLPLHKLDAYEGTVNVTTSLGRSGFRFLIDAQPVSTSADAFEFAPTEAGETTPWASLMYRNEGAETVAVTGYGLAGPFEVSADCLDKMVLDPGDDCLMSLRFVPTPPYLLGLVEGRLGVRFSSGLVDLPIRAFVYSREVHAGVSILVESIEPLGFSGAAARAMHGHLARIERALQDGRPQNDRKACPQLRQLIRLVEHEAARERVPYWSALAMVVQSRAVWTSLNCPGRLR